MTDSPDPLLGRGARARTGLLERPGPGGGGDHGDGDGEPGGGPPAGAGGGRPGHRIAWLVTAAVVLLGLVFVTVLPVRSYVQQRRDVSRAEAALAQLEADNQALQARVAELGTNEALEKLAREQLKLVHEGEEAFALLPPQFPTDLPTIFPYPLARRLLEPEG